MTGHELVAFQPGELPVREQDIIAYGRECLRVGKLANEAFGRACQALKDGHGSYSWARVAEKMGCGISTVYEARIAAGFHDREIVEPQRSVDHDIRPDDYAGYANSEDLPDGDPYGLDDGQLFGDAPQGAVPGEVIWSERETRLLDKLKNGQTVVLSMRATGDPNLWRWAQENGLAVKIDRSSEWGNPFEMPADGDRHTVILNYAQHYLPYKPRLLQQLPTLRGKALGCWCAPEPCHGDVLRDRAEP